MFLSSFLSPCPQGGGGAGTLEEGTGTTLSCPWYPEPLPPKDWALRGGPGRQQTRPRNTHGLPGPFGDASPASPSLEGEWRTTEATYMDSTLPFQHTLKEMEGTRMAPGSCPQGPLVLRLPMLAENIPSKSLLPPPSGLLRLRRCFRVYRWDWWAAGLPWTGNRIRTRQKL